MVPTLFAGGQCLINCNVSVQTPSDLSGIACNLQQMSRFVSLEQNNIAVDVNVVWQSEVLELFVLLIAGVYWLDAALK